MTSVTRQRVVHFLISGSSIILPQMAGAATINSGTLAPAQCPICRAQIPLAEPRFLWRWLDDVNYTKHSFALLLIGILAFGFGFPYIPLIFCRRKRVSEFRKAWSKGT